ncbi:MAG: metallopeptidase family protein [Anaerolineae bacterium]|nr:metallopeptidase family protein [Anaerolineae bacterium]
MADPDVFDRLVAEAMASLPDEIRERMDNVVVTVADWPTCAELTRAGVPAGASLFGLYEGVPLTQRTSNYGLVPPDKITLFRGPLLTYFRDPDVLREQIRRTIIHEVAHHFGMSEAQIHRLGY